MFRGFRKAVSTATGYTSGLAGKAKSRLHDAAGGVAGKAASVVSYGAEQADSLSRKTSDVADRHWPHVEKVAVDGLLSVALDRLDDEKSVRGAVETAYELLPTPVRLVLSRERYLKLALDNRKLLVAKAAALKSARDAKRATESARTADVSTLVDRRTR